MISNPDSFVGPTLWAEYQDTLRSSLASDDSRFLAAFESINYRNTRATVPGMEKRPSPRKRLIRLLDTTFSEPSLSDVPKRCWQIDEDKSMLLRVVLEWSTSSYRPGKTKIYVAARLMRFWCKSGIDITESILDFLDSDASAAGCDKPSFYHLVSELTRSEHFSTARYLQWLISRGGLHDATEVASDGPCATRLLAELPLHNLSDGILSLHRTLLDRADLSVDEEEDRMKICMASMNRTLPSIQANVDSELEIDSLPISDDIPALILQLSRSSKSEIGLWLRHKIRLQMQQPTIPLLEDWDTAPMKCGTSAITGTDFNTFRYYLELIDDHSMLADVLKIVATSNNAEVLASCADTLNLHIDTFAAIGALHELFDVLMTRLPVLVADQESMPRIILVSLSDLAARIPGRNGIADQLSQELSLKDRKNAADACSPVSDHMAMTQTAETDFTDEIEKVLASGNSMDQATLDRLFQRVVLRLETFWEKSAEQQRSCGLLLTRLRTFDAQHFDKLIYNWTLRFLSMPGRPSMIRVFGPLISFGCLSFQAVLAGCEAMNGKVISTSQSPNNRIAKELLMLLLGDSTFLEGMGVDEIYRFRIKQDHVQRDSAGKVLISIRQVVLEEQQSFEIRENPGLDTSILFDNGSFWELLRKFALLHTASMLQALVIPMLREPGSKSATSITSIIDRLLLGHSQQGPISIERILNIANDLTLPFCQIKLDSMFSSEDSTMSGTEDGRSEHLEAFDVAIEAAVDSGKTAWASIVPLLDSSVAHHLRRRAQLQFLALFPSPKSHTYDDLALESRTSHAENLLRIIESTASSSTVATLPANANHVSLATDMITILNGIRILLATSQTVQIKDAIVAKWMPLLLSFITMHTSEFEVTRTGHESRAKAILALSAIMLELQALDTSTEAVNGLIEYTFDLALCLVDSLPDDVRQQCIRSLCETMNSPQLHYIFSFAASPSGWLILSQKESIPVSGGGPRGEGDRRSHEKEKLTPFPLRKWELLGDSTPHFGENDTSLSLTLFGARRG